MCYGVEGGLGHWETTYPTMGLNFKSWIQKKEPAEDGYCVEKPEYQILIHDNCYSYEIMTKICLLVKYQKEKDTPDYESGKYTWTYTGGCYNDGHPVLYE
jgi:hypothetical protein